MQAVLGKSCLYKSWEGCDIDIFVHESQAPVVRKWLLDQYQVFSGCSSTYNHEEFDRNVSHVEHYTNRDDSKFSYANAISRGRLLRRHELFEGDESRMRSIEVLTCFGESMPFKPFEELGSKKSVVNIDLVVVRQGRDVYNALDVFDLNICKSCFDGKFFSVPLPLQTFRGYTELTSIVYNVIAKTYLAGIIRESRRDIESVVNEMDIYRFKHRYGVVDLDGMKAFVEKLVSVGNVFSHSIIRPIMAGYYSPCVHFVCLVLDIRNHLIGNALERVREIGLSAQPRGIVNGIEMFLSSSAQPRLLHNTIIRLCFKRYDKYLKRGICIKDLPDKKSWQELSDVLRFLPGFPEIVRGVTWPEEYRFGDRSDSSLTDDDDGDSTDSDEEGGAEDDDEDVGEDVDEGDEKEDEDEGGAL